MGIRYKRARLTAAAVLAAALAGCGSYAATCDPGRVELRGDWGQARFSVEVADDASERATGLMNRPEMASSRGMLFLYDSPVQATFWMKNTLIPLDMIFVSPEGRVLRIHENARPLDESVIDGGPGVQAVLEINGGLARRLGIVEGSELRHPGLDQETALWPCD